jgi:4-hydroxy-3-methylbut-2-enyl diphosphate reductase
MKQFVVPEFYRSPLIAKIKQARKQTDKLKKDFTPTAIDLGPVTFLLARHFGFCYGVENAIEIAFRTLAENPGKKIYLLSEMIHNPGVNADLQAAGIVFLQDTYGKQLIPFESLSADDIVLIPAFGTTLPIEEKLRSIGIPIEKYNTTCPFVEKVWNRSEQIAKKQYSIVIHGKPKHEETRATFSHAAANAPAVIVNDMEDTIALGKYITGEEAPETFYTRFAGLYSEGFNVERDLQRLGVVNQTTQLASDTQAIAEYLKNLLKTHHGLDETQIGDRFADTRDTLCYATNDNQTAVLGMLEVEADLAVVVGGYNSSNTTHLVELCEKRLPTYFIDGAARLISKEQIEHYDYHTKTLQKIDAYLPAKSPLRILVTSGASCPDAVVEDVIKTLAGYWEIKPETVEAWTP